MTDLIRQVYVLPYWDRSCRSNFLHQALTHVPGRVATWVPVFKSPVWPDPEKSLGKRDLNPQSSTLEADALTTRPQRRSHCSYLCRGWGREDKDVGDRCIPGSLQRTVGTLLLLLLQGVRHHLETGVHLHGNHAGAAHTRGLAGQGAQVAHLPNTAVGCLQVLLAQQPWPTCGQDSEGLITAHMPNLTPNVLHNTVPHKLSWFLLKNPHGYSGLLAHILMDVRFCYHPLSTERNTVQVSFFKTQSQPLSHSPYRLWSLEM